MSDKSSPTSSKSKVDDELSELLDSALQDFSTADKSNEEVGSSTKKNDEVGKNAKPDELSLDGLGTDVWSEEFIRQASQNFDPNFMNMLGLSGQTDPSNASNLSSDQMKQNFELMAAAAQVFLNQDGGEMSSDFAATITQAVQELSQGAEAAGNIPESGDPNAFIPPFMQGMMQSLLSKEVLYPSLKDVLEKFPEYLEKNAEKLTEDDKIRYENQQKLMREVCKVLEDEKETDSNEIKSKRFDEVLNLMQKLQDYGQPPTELVGDVGPTPDMKNCSIM